MASIGKIRRSKKKREIIIDKLDEVSTGQVWRLLDTEYNDPVLNLAVDEAILEKVGAGEAPDTLRFWRNPNTVVVVGRFQIPQLEVNDKAYRKYSATIVRRFTGGGTVYNDRGNLNYSISVRRSNPIVPRVIAEITPTLCKGVVKGLRTLGLNAEFEPEGVYIHIDGKKISGTAGLVKRTVAFTHGTLLVSSDLAKLREILDVPPYPPAGNLRRFVKSVRREVTSVEAELGRKISVADVREAIERGFAEAFGIELRRAALPESEFARAEEIASKNREVVFYSQHS